MGQSWTVPVYSAFRPPHASPMEVLQATVEYDEPITWDARPVTCRVVVLRSTPGSDLSSAPPVRGRMWVDADGMVLKQELNIFQSKLSFVRVATQPPTDDTLRPELTPWW